jgi:hypothetical protein
MVQLHNQRKIKKNKLEEMTHVHAEVEKSINNAVESNKK